MDVIFKPFGDTLWTSGGNMNRDNFDGSIYDTESDLQMLGFRMYDNETGRFTTPDLLWSAFPAQTPYHYAYNSPMTYRDPSGLAPEKEKEGEELVSEQYPVFETSEIFVYASREENNRIQVSFSFGNTRKVGGRIGDENAPDDLGDGGGGTISGSLAYVNPYSSDLMRMGMHNLNQALNANTTVGNGLGQGSMGAGVNLRTLDQLADQAFSEYKAMFGKGMPFSSAITNENARGVERLLTHAKLLDGLQWAGVGAVLFPLAPGTIALEGINNSEYTANIPIWLLGWKSGLSSKILKTSGWVKRSVFNSLDPLIQKKVSEAMMKGIVSPTGQQGIIKLTNSEAIATGYQYKIKILGKGGDIRIYGNPMDNGHILFDKIIKH